MNKEEGAGLKIRLFGDPALRKKTKPVKQVTPAHRDILSEMAQLMYANSGIGLAAPQVGVNESMLVVDIGQGLYKLINPKIIEKEGHQIMEEGCLSLPGVCIKVKRAKKVVVEAKDENFKPVTIEAEGLLASVFQHELDHLNGKLIIDYASLLGKLKIKKKLRELKNKVRYEGLPESERKSCKLQL
ncbi:MAG: peptide deformylase [Candidatus Omnitrophica bacterium CG23_combo_of_CG06-09_8_20_14_all_40_11]|nr:MAG: peptide deformylase [Candidatus Omnitrophica bacterium CG23_combo_of_CG06-09_8_20_14_all_40_11]